MSSQPPDVIERVRFHADRVEECGHLNAARYMRCAADEIEHLRAQSAARLRIINAKIATIDGLRAYDAKQAQS